MKISINRLKKYTKIPKDKKELGILLDKFAIQSVDIDNIIHYGKNLSDIYIGKITKIEKHPNADKLQIVNVTIKEKSLVIVTGASNIYIGMICPVILDEGILPNGTKIKSSELRGVMSNGMLCSEKELELSDDHEGIMDLGDEYKDRIGEKLSKYISDTIIDIDNKVISNRTDLFSHIGIAREFAAIQKEDFKNISLNPIKNPIEDNIQITLDDEFCTRYIAIIIKDIKIGKSPVWLKEELRKIGIKSINNIVDITNYVMTEIGQPLHAFDLDKISDGKNPHIIVRKAKNGEIIKTLDSKERKLNENNYLIANEEKGLGIAGVMGGEDSEIDNNTKSILLESAIFNPILIRKSSKQVNLRTEASLRYEKGIPEHFALQGILLAIDMIQNLNYGKIDSNITDIQRASNTNIKISLSEERIYKILGIKISTENIIDILKRLDFKVSSENNLLQIDIPPQRKDIKEDVDIIEEIGRIYGYDKIPEENPIYESSKIKRNIIYDTELEIKKILVSQSSYEIKTYSFISKDLARKSNIDITNAIKIINPLSEDFTHLRETLVPSMLNTVALNTKNSDNFSLFEIANVYLRSEEELPKEDLFLCVSKYSKNKKNDTFFEIKGIFTNLCEYLNINESITFKKGTSKKYGVQKQSAEIIINDNKIGDIINIHPEVKENFNINGNLSILLININEIIPYISDKFIYIKYSKYPEIVEDINITYNKNLVLDDILVHIKDPALKSFNIIDIYEGKPLKEDQISITIKLIFQNFEGTFKSEEIKNKISSIKNTLKNEFKNIDFR